MKTKIGSVGLLLGLVLTPFVFLCAQQEVVGAGSLTDPNIRYIGRWDKSQPDVFTGYWSGVFLRARFTGTSVGIELKGATRLRVSIDNAEPRELDAGEGVTSLITAPLPDGVHTIQVGSAGQNYEVPFQGLVLAAGATTKPVETRPIIEYIGDSITVGTDSYSFLSATMVGADPALIAFSGVGLTSGYGCSTKVGQDTQYFRLKNFNHSEDQPQKEWDFSYTPKIIVINLGQNDQCGNEPEETFTASYVSFVQKLRTKFPKTLILAMRPFGGPYEKSVRQAVETLTAKGDKEVRYVDTTGWLSPDDYRDGVHPNWTGNLKAASHLAPLLEAP